MATLTARRQAGAEGTAGRSRARSSATTSSAGPTSTTRPSAVSFGTSGHRGSSLHGIVQRGAHPRHHPGDLRVPPRRRASTARSSWARTRTRSPAPAQRTALEVLAANGVETVIQRDDGVTPTPVISRAILVHNRGRDEHLADGIVITPSHNPPEDGGFKYNPPNGGPADTDVTGWIQDRANDAAARPATPACKRMPLRAALAGRDDARARTSSCPTSTTSRNVVDMDAIRARRPQARRRSARRRRRALLGADRRASTGSTSRS